MRFPHIHIHIHTCTRTYSEDECDYYEQCHLSNNKNNNDYSNTTNKKINLNNTCIIHAKTIKGQTKIIF